MRLVTMLLLAVAASACTGELGASPTQRAPATPSISAAAPTPATSPTAAASPPRAAADVHWEQLTTINAPDPLGDWRLIGGFKGGYVALQRSPPAAWFSPEGMTWTRTALEAPDGFAGTAATIASNGVSIIVGGDYVPCTKRQYADDPFHQCRPRPVTWISSDGIDWRSSGPWDGPNGEEGRSGSSFLSVWSVPPGGWDAGQMFDLSDESDEGPPAGPAMWHSSDGLGWDMLTDAPGEDVQCRMFGVTESFRAAADATGRRVAAASAGEDCTFPVFSSSDGLAYEPVESFPLEPPMYMTVVMPPVDGWPWRLFGGVEGTGQGRAWSSSDLVTWSMTPLNDAGQAVVVLAAIHEPGRDVAVGRIDEQGGTWTSEDGVTWLLAADATTSIEALAAGPVGTLGLAGTWSADGNGVTGFEVWKLVAGR